MWVLVAIGGAILGAVVGIAGFCYWLAKGVYR